MVTIIIKPEFVKLNKQNIIWLQQLNVLSGTKVRTPLRKYIITSMNAALHRHWPDFMAPPISNDLMKLFDEVSVS